MGLEDLTPEQRRQLQLGEILLSNPEVAKSSLRLAKKAKPELRLPEIDLEDAIAAEAQKREEWQEKQEQREIEQRVEHRRREHAQAAKDAGFTQEEIEKIVVDEKCSFETALRLANLQRETAVPGAADTAYGGRSPSYARDIRPDADLRKKSPSELRRWGLNTAHEMLDDYMKRARGGQR